jgi:hypothetical protein
MKHLAVAVAAAGAPSIGPAVVTLFGTQVPVLSFGLSLIGLLFARAIAPPPLRKLTRFQEVSLTVLLIGILFLIVTGELLGTAPLGPGMAFMWAVGLGFSGLMVIEFFGDRVMAMLRAAFGKTNPP